MKTTKQNILVGICGGIAAYKAAELVRLLTKTNCNVKVMMTEAAGQFITPLTLQALSGNPVFTALLDVDQENAMSHITLARWAKSIIIAPASANTIAKLRLGLADNIIPTVCLAATCPIILAPAMNQAMWLNSAVQENIKCLQQRGYRILGPAEGAQACGETGPGRMIDPFDIINSLLPKAINQSDTPLKILISAGPTREPIDPVRYLTNRSSGKMGFAVANAALDAGAKVTLVSGPVQLSPPQEATTLPVETASQMYETVLTQAPHHHIFIAAAAVADYRPSDTAVEKIKKTSDKIQLSLTKTQDILAAVAKLKPPVFTIGFAAETTNLESYAAEKLRQKNIDMIAANWVNQPNSGFESDNNALVVFWQKARIELPLMNKQALADRLFSLIIEKYYAKHPTENTG